MLNFEDVDRFDLSDVHPGTLPFMWADPFRANCTVGVFGYRKAIGSGFQKVRVHLAVSVELGIRVETDCNFGLTPSHLIL